MDTIRSLVLSIGVLLLLIGSTVHAQPQEVQSRIEEGRFIIELDKRWNAEMRNQAMTVFQLDSTMISAVLSGKAGSEISAQDEKWSVTKIDNYRYEISKSIEGMAKADDWGKVWISDPDAQNQMQGPGYPDPVSTVFGYNNFKTKTFSQIGTGKVKILLNSKINARQLVITGSFINWSTSGIPMKQTAEGWEVNLELKPGKYYYKFIADGKWMHDPNNNNREPDGYGNYNSVFYVTNKRFELQGHEKAKDVMLAGSFNNWKKKDARLNRTDRGWAIDVYLRDGTYTYKFIVDGNWIFDESNPKSLPDGMGRRNSVIAQGEHTLFNLQGYASAKKVILSGSFNGWREDELMMIKTETGWQLPYVLATGNYEYRFIVDGKWISDPNNPYRINHGDHDNSFIAINPNHTFTLEGFPPSSKVLVTGSFTGWSHDNNVMVRRGDSWIFPMYITPGKHHYKFIINGEWIVDPTNPYYEDNEFRTGNSVLWIESGQVGLK